jgi:hypothetical protein
MPEMTFTAPDRAVNPPPSHRPAAPHGTAERLARVLHRLAERDSVRAIEGIAASLCNRAEHLARPDAAGGRRFVSRCEALSSLLDDRGGDAGAGDPDIAADPAYAMCLRVARRAVGGALTDPTGGATLCHPVERTPRWARDQAPIACIGRFLFYREAA